MGKITRTASTKHEATLSPGTQSYVAKLSKAPLHEVPSELDSFPKRWPFPRGDLYHWIELLNRFDTILEKFISLYGLDDGPQVQQFGRDLLLQGDGDATEEAKGRAATAEQLDGLGLVGDADRELVETILRFTQLLLENCSNRSLYASSGRLNDLLNTTSLSLLEQTLRLGHRLAQRYAMSRHKSGTSQSHSINTTLLHTHYMIDLDKVERIAQPFLKNLPDAKDASQVPSSLTSRMRPDLLSMVRGPVPSEWQHAEYIHIKLIEKSASLNVRTHSLSHASNGLPASPTTPTPLRRHSPQGPSKLVYSSSVAEQNEVQSTSSKKNVISIDGPGLDDPGSIMLGTSKFREEPLEGVVGELMAGVQQEFRYELLQKLRCIQAWLSHNTRARQRVVAVRLLAIMNLAYIYPEHMFQQKIFNHESEEPRRNQLPHQLCDLLHPPGQETSHIPKQLQSLAMGTLEGLLCFKSKVGDVATALNVTASHGVLAYIVRKAVAELKMGSPYEDFIKRESLSDKLMLELSDDQDTEDLAWFDSLVSLLETFPKSGRFSEGMVSTGLLELFVEVLDCRTVRAHREHPKVISLVDAFVYHTRDAFQHLVDSNGLNSISHLLAFEVETSLSLIARGYGISTEWKVSSIDFDIPFLQQQTLRSIFKLLRNLMPINGGQFDRLLRNLIESSELLDGLRRVISSPRQFGSNVWSGAVTVLSSFIHTEPTSYAAIAEAGLTTTFLETITGRSMPQKESTPNDEDEDTNEQDEAGETTLPASDADAVASDTRSVSAGVSTSLPNAGIAYIPASGESISAILFAFSAICLNEGGTQQLLDVNALGVFSKFFTSAKHIKALASSSSMDVDDLGSNVEELARHHPRLKPEIVKMVVKLTQDVRNFAFKVANERPSGPSLFVLDPQGCPIVQGGRTALLDPYDDAKIQPNREDSTGDDGDIEMTDVSPSQPSNNHSSELTFDEIEKIRKETDQTTLFEVIGIFSRFLWGFMKNSDLCASFCSETDGIENILAMSTVNSIFFDVATHHTMPNTRLSRLVHVICDNKPHLVLPVLVRRLLNGVESLHQFNELVFMTDFVKKYGSDIQKADFFKGADATASGSGTALIRKLVGTVDMCGLLTKCLVASHARSPTSTFSLVNLTDLYVPIISKLGELQRACVWGSANLQQYDPFPTEKKTSESSSNPVTTTNGQDTNVPAANDSEAAHESGPELLVKTKIQKDALHRNVYTLRYLFYQASIFVNGLFGSIGKTILVRRFPGDRYQKNNILIIANSVSRALVKQLRSDDLPSQEPATIQYFQTTMMSMAPLVLVDKRHDGPERHLLTLLIRAFKDLGGFTRLGDLVKDAVGKLLEMDSSKLSEEQTRTQSTLINAISPVLKFFSQVVHSKNVLEASHTIVMSSRGNDRTRADFFIGHQFLVDLRYVVLRNILPVWNSPNVQALPPVLLKMLANLLLQVWDYTGEFGASRRGDPVPNWSEVILQGHKFRSQDSITRLTTLANGYSEDLAREALYRCMDNITSAKDYCAYFTANANRSERFSIPKWDASTSAQEAENDHTDSDEPPSTNAFPAGLHAILNNRNIELEDLATHDNTFELDFETYALPDNVPATIDDVQDERNSIRADLMDRCLTILGASDEVTFELAALITACTPKSTDKKQPGEDAQQGPVLGEQEVCETLIHSLISFQGSEDLESHGKKIGSCAHLLGILLHEDRFFDAAADNINDCFPSLVSYLLPQSEPQSGDKPAPWIGQTMLILERILAEDARPIKLTWEVPKSEDGPIVEAVAESGRFTIADSDKHHLFGVLIDMMPRIGKSSALALSIIRIMLILTRSRPLAVRLGEKRNMQKLFVMVKQLAGTMSDQFRTAFMIVLRHIVEDEDIVRQILRSEIRAWFEKPPHPIDTTAYARNLGFLILRAPKLFIEVTNELLHIPKFAPGAKSQTLAMKKADPPATSAQSSSITTDAADSSNALTEAPKLSAENNEASEKAVKPSELKTPTVEHTDDLVHYLLSELLSYKDVDERPNLTTAAEQSKEITITPGEDVEMITDDGVSSTAGTNTDPQEPKTGEKEPGFKAEEHPVFVYRCFIVNCLTELLQSYNRTKIEFINFSRKADTQTSTPSKPRSGVLNYILNVLIPVGSIQHPDDIASKKRASTSHCAMGLIFALCARTTEKGPTKPRDTLDHEDEPDLLFIRRFVLEHALKAFKDANLSSEPVEVRYSKLLHLAELFSRLLAAKPSQIIPLRRQQDSPEDYLVPSQKQIAKIMFEKNFLNALTAAISEVDLSVPGSNRVIKYILRPLKLMTQTAINLAWSSDAPTTPGQIDADEISSATSISDEDGEGHREETPDLFRNSTLGMFEPGREDQSSSEPSDGSDDEDEMYGDAYADDMEFEEEEGPDDDDDEPISDEDEEMEGIGPMEGLSGDIGVDMEISLSGDDSDHSMSDTSDLDEDDDDEDEDEDLEDEDDRDEVDEDNGDAGRDSGRIDLVNEIMEGMMDESEMQWPDDDQDGEVFRTRTGGVSIDPTRLNREPGSDNEDEEPFIGGLPDSHRDPHDEDEEEEEVHFEIHDPFPETDGLGEDESEGDEDEEDDEEDLEEDEEMIFGGEDLDEDESEMPPFALGNLEGMPLRRPIYTNHLPSYLRREHPTPNMMHGYQSHRPNLHRSNEDGINSLLSRGRPSQPSTTPPPPPSSSRRMGMTPMFDLDQSLPRIDLPQMLGDGHLPMGILGELLHVIGNGSLPPTFARFEASLQGLNNNRPVPSGPAIQVNMSQRPGRHDGEMEAVLEIERRDFDPSMRQLHGHGSSHHHHHSHQHHFHTVPPPPPNGAEPFTIVDCVAHTTISRWQDAAKHIFGSSVSEKAQMVIPAILQLLVPKAMEVARELKAQEQAKREEEQRAKEKAEQEAREREEAEKARLAEERAAAERAAAEAAASVSAAGGATPDGDTGTSGAVRLSDTMEGVESAEANASLGDNSGEGTQSRVTTTIGGHTLDITDLGIDMEFLSAIPEEFRQEVIMQRFSEQRSEAAAAGRQPTANYEEFLDALPDEWREGLLQQEEEERRRTQRQEDNRRRATAGEAARAEDIDNASFMASLDPDLRRAILADVDEAELAHLPAHFAAEARSHRRGPPLSSTGRFVTEMDFQNMLSARRPGATEPDRQNTSKPQKRPIVQMFDKAGVATLLRLMYVPIHDHSRSNVNCILRNASGNYQTRAEIVSGLLSILQDGSADVGAIERSFSQLTVRAKQGPVNKTPQSSKKLQSLPNLNGAELTPLMVISYCLSALGFLTKQIPQVPKFFLTEHELSGSMKTKTSKKGKGKEIRANKFPINSLLGLLDRELVVDNSQVMDHLASLLQHVTQPLPSMLKKEKEESSKSNEGQQGGETSNDGQTGQDLLRQVMEQVARDTTVGESSQPEPEGSSSQAQKSSEPGKIFVTPEIPDENLRLIINILTARDCSSNTFRDTLSTINNLSSIPSAKRVFGQELVKRARQLGQKIQADLGNLIKALQGAQNEMEAQSLTLANFSPAGSDQSKLSRILTALDYLFDTSRSGEKKEKSTDGADILSRLYDDPAFSSLWHQLSACLSATQQAEKYFLNVATILLPLIESLMVVCKTLTSDWRTPKAAKDSLPTTPAAESTMKSIFFTFTNQHKKILNDLVRQNPKLMSGSFAVLVKNSSVLEFDNKRNYFTRRLHHRSSDMRYPHQPLQLTVRRDQVFRESYRALYFKKAEEIKYGKLNIRFRNEEGVDAGGVTREWFQVLARQMFDANYALFNPVASDRTTFHPNPFSSVNEEHLSFFQFIGRIIGKALYENRVLDCHFSRAVYKQIIGKPVSLKDMETIDLDYSKSLQWMLDNDITNILAETFSITENRFGATEVIDLIENGRNIPVTEENKQEYVKLVIEYKLTGSVQEQLKKFLEGFYDIVPADLISIFDEGELELLISGMPEVDVDDWKNHTEYASYTSSSPQIQWFWRAVRSFDKEERAKLLQFVTGTGKVPLNGFKELEGMNGFTKFSIHKDFGNKDRLPSSHTCFNQLDLPEYDSYESLRNALYTAMTTGGDYFGFA